VSKIYFFTFVSSFLQAHDEAKERFLRNFCDEVLTSAKVQVLSEVDSQVELANRHILTKFRSSEYSLEAKHAMSLLFCSILLNEVALLIDQLISQGLLKQVESDYYLEDIDHTLDYLYYALRTKSEEFTDSFFYLFC